MNILVTIIMLLFFPLNSFLALNGKWVEGKVVEPDSRTSYMEGEVKGIEKVKDEDLLTNLLPKPEILPVRKEGISDLVVPDAHASIILDVDSGTILHYNNGRDRRQIASLTKMMTAVLVMEKVKDLNETVQIDKEVIKVEGTRVGCPNTGICPGQQLVIGEKVKVVDLLKAMLMNSANDAATALGKHVGGSIDNFVSMMNLRAKELGLTDTNFCTPSGLEIAGKEKECYSSAYDIARITAHALKFEKIWEIFRLPSNLEIQSVDGKYTHTVMNTNRILDEMPNALGGKTGFTPLAGHSLLMAAKDNSKKHAIVSVLLDDPHRWEDIKTMINWTFDSYNWK